MTRLLRGSLPLALPYMTGIALLVVVPALIALTLAFTEFNGLQEPRFSGLDNFKRLVNDDLFRTALKNSFIFAIVFVPLRLVGATALALLLHRDGPLSSAGRTAAFLPSIVPEVTWALMWLWILNPIYGPLAAAFRSMGFGEPGLLTDPTTARVALAAIAAFQIGEGFLVALAVRRSIPERLYEASAVDGGGKWFTLRHLTLPMMAPALGLLALRDLVLALQVNFTTALLITDGGPRLATTYIPLYIYRAAFRYLRLGYASALSLTMFVLTGVIIYVQYRLARRWRLL